MALLNDEKKNGNPKAASVRIQGDTMSGYSGQRRHDLRIGPQPKYVDVERSPLNRTLLEPPLPAVMKTIAATRRAKRETQRAMKSNSAIATAGIITFGSQAAQMFEAVSEEDQDRAFRLLARAIAMRLRTSLHGLVVHRDEATIHAHFTLSSHNRHGVPLSKSTRPAVLSGLQDLTAQVMQRFCPEIERGNRYGDRLAAGADWSDTIHKSVHKLHRELPGDLAAKQAQLDALAADEETARARVAEMEERVAKLNQKTDLTSKEVKRLATYQKRLEDRNAELEQALSTSEAGRIEAERLAALAAESRAREEAKTAEAIAKSEAMSTAMSSLTEEVAAETLRRTPAGKITAKSPERLKPAYPEIAPVVQAAVSLVEHIRQKRRDAEAAASSIHEEREALAEDREAIAREWSALRKMRAALDVAMGRVRAWLGRPDLPAEARVEGEDMLRDVTRDLPPPEDDNDGPGM